MPQDAPPLFQRLLELSKRADAEERRLDEVRRAYERTHDGRALESLRETARRALDAEVEFERVWNEAARRLKERR